MVAAECVVELLYGGSLSCDSYAVIDVKRNVHRMAALGCDDGGVGVAFGADEGDECWSVEKFLTVPFPGLGVGVYRVRGADRTPQKVGLARGGLSGIGGWLLFFIVVQALVGLGVVGLGVSLFFGNGPYLGPVLLIVGLLHLGQPVVLLWKWRYALQYTRAYLVVSTIGVFVIELLAAQRGGLDVSDGGVAGGVAAQVLPQIVFCIIWLSYFSRSVRVKNTYRSD